MRKRRKAQSKQKVSDSFIDDLDDLSDIHLLELLTDEELQVYLASKRSLKEAKAKEEPTPSEQSKVSPQQPLQTTTTPTTGFTYTNNEQFRPYRRILK